MSAVVKEQRGVSEAPPVTQMLADFVSSHASRGWSDAVEAEAHRTFMAAAAMHTVAGVSLLTAFLSLAPGGTAEMAIIAKTYGIGAPAVTAFHFFRVVATIVLTGWMAQKLADSGWLTR